MNKCAHMLIHTYTTINKINISVAKFFLEDGVFLGHIQAEFRKILEYLHISAQTNLLKPSKKKEKRM